jgi:cytochrome c553
MKIVLAIFLALFMVACSDENKTEKEQVHKNDVKKEIVHVVEVKSEVVKPKKVEKEEKAEAPVVKVVEVKEVIAVVEVKKDDAKKADVKKAAETQVKKVVSTVDGAKVYKACAACHGANAQSKALGKSKVIKAWAPQKTIDALNGYLAGTYGGSLKGVMKGQVKKLNKDEIKAVAEYISKL